MDPVLLFSERFCKKLIAVALSTLLPVVGIAQVSSKPSANTSSGAAERGVALASRGKCRDALPLLKRSSAQIAEKNLKYDVMMSMARCLIGLEQTDSAVRALLELNRSFPKDPEVLYLTTHYYSELAMKASRDLAAAAPSSPQAQQLEAEAFESQGEWDKAITQYHKILEQNPQRATATRWRRTIMPATPGANLPTAPLSDGSSACSPNASNFPVQVMCSINASVKYGALTSNANGDPNIQQVNWLVNAPITHYWPTVRVDYDATQKLRFNFAWNMTKDNFINQNTPNFPGPDWAKTGAGNKDTNYTAAFGFGWTLSPTMVNEFRGGFLYNSNVGAYNAPPLQQNLPQLGWNYTNVFYPYGAEQSGTVFYTGINTYYPIFNASDTMTWQHKAHTMNFGFSWWREQDHYYNPVLGYPVVNFGLAGGDAAQSAFPLSAFGGDAGAQAAAQQLYAILTGRISGVSGSYSFSPSQNQYVPAIGRYNLNELEKGWGLFFQDSFRVRHNLTINYGLRWDFNSADKDLSNLYHSASVASIWGPSGVNNLFNPGSLKGDMNPQIAQISQAYNNWNVSPQPAVGIAWNPKFENGFLSKLTGIDKTVIRAGYSLRKFTEPQQYVWNQASDFASFYYQSFFLNANTSGAPGTFAPGSLSIASFNSSLTGAGAVNAFGVPYGLSPKSFLKTEPASDFTFNGGPGLNGIQYNIQQPYTQSWNLGIQRALGDTRALEVRYIGSRTLRQWIQTDPNEVNIFENGF